MRVSNFILVDVAYFVRDCTSVNCGRQRACAFRCIGAAALRRHEWTKRQVRRGRGAWRTKRRVERPRERLSLSYVSIFLADRPTHRSGAFEQPWRRRGERLILFSSERKALVKWENWSILRYLNFVYNTEIIRSEIKSVISKTSSTHIQRDFKFRR